jgi:hypothetical protein
MTDDQSPRSSTAILIASFTSVRGVFFGVGLMLYCMCVQVLFGDFKKRRRPRGQTVFSFVYCSLIVSCSLTSLATSTDVVVQAVTRHEDDILAYIGSITLGEGSQSVYAVWTCIAPVLLLGLPAAMQVRLLCFDDLITLSIISGLDLADMDYLDWILLCHCRRWSTSLGIAGCSR